ncbi:MAG: hypothetical protein D6788_05640, partial [Planctomycetota bacterium]
MQGERRSGHGHHSRGIHGILLIGIAVVGAAVTRGQDDIPLRPVVCFAPGTDPSVVQAVTQAGFGRAARNGVAYVFSDVNRWPGPQGSPKQLTWSLMPDGVFISVDLGGGCSVNGPSELFSRMDSLFASQGGRATWIARFQEVFDRWSALTGTTYTRLSVAGQDWDDGASFGSSGNGSTRGDIRIGMVPVLGNGCGGILAFNFFPGSGVGGEMVLNTDFNWASAANNYRFLRNVVAHEHGHGLLIDHVSPDNGTKLMEPFLSTSFDGPTHDDIRAGQRGYGDPFEPDDSTAQATHLGIVAGGDTIVMGTGGTGSSPFPFPDPPVSFGSILSLDADGEQDYFSFEVTGPLSVTITVTPIGFSYDSSTQALDGSCNSGNIIDSAAIADLNVDLIDVDGVTVLATSAGQPAGGGETIGNFALPSAGVYFVRVYEGNNPSETQLYELRLSGAGLCGNGVCDPTETPCNCPTDCGADVCGDGCCGPTENACNCPSDCGATTCGDGCCGAGEDSCNCPGDCGPTTCGDGCCGAGEDSCNCPADCGPTTCGDGCCGAGEDSCNCPTDCGATTCGDGCCGANEDSCNCPTDCGATTCGDGCCGAGEDSCNCPA